MPELPIHVVDQGVVGILPNSPHRRIPGMEHASERSNQRSQPISIFLPSTLSSKSSEYPPVLQYCRRALELRSSPVMKAGMPMLERFDLQWRATFFAEPREMNDW
jgi:hypothetical protein